MLRRRERDVNSASASAASDGVVHDSAYPNCGPCSHVQPFGAVRSFMNVSVFTPTFTFTSFASAGPRLLHAHGDAEQFVRDQDVLRRSDGRDLEICEEEQGGQHHQRISFRYFGSSASINPSPRKFNPITASMIAAPGKIARWLASPR